MSDNNLPDFISDCRKTIELSENLNNLMILPSFKKVILNNLFKDKVNDLVFKLASLEKNSVAYSETLRELDSISYLQNYLSEITQKGNRALLDIKEAEHYLYNGDEE